MCGQPTAKFNLGSAQSVAAVLRKHVLFELEGIDRMYLNAFGPVLQAGEGVLKFIRIHRGHPMASTAIVEPITRRLEASIEAVSKLGSGMSGVVQPLRRLQGGAGRRAVAGLQIQVTQPIVVTPDDGYSSEMLLLPPTL
jgi:hypothetical protein